MSSDERSDRRAEDGVALVTVLGFTLVAMLLVTAAVNFAVNTLPQTRDHEDWNAALAAAEAGADDLRYRLNQDPLYWTTFDGDNDALTGWQDIPGGTGGAQYHYRIDSGETTRFGFVDVTVAGRVRDQVRTIEVRMRRDGFLDNIYFTDFETSDPFALTTDADLRTELDTRCAVYHPVRPRQAINSGGCGDIRFAPGDVLRGPTRSNDAIMINAQSGNPRFLGPVRTGWDGRDESGAPTGRLYIRETGSNGEPHFRDGIETRERIPLPETTAELASNAAASGCLYEGPTYIRFRTNPPRMTVRSPLTNPATVNPGCGTGTVAGGINSTVPLKDGEVLYAANSAKSVSTHPLQMPPPSTVVDDDFYGGGTDFPRRRRTTSFTPEFDARAGDLFIHGRLNGRMTVGAESDVVIVHDLEYADSSEESLDLLGLISGNNVSVYHPIREVRTQTRSCSGSGSSRSCGSWSTGTVARTNADLFGTAHGPFSMAGGGGFSSASGLWPEPRIHAAILALNRSFGVQNFNRGAAQGDLHVYGAIAQKFRGPVATGSGSVLASGYDKDYVYDERLRFLSPPYFLSPTVSPWGRRTWAELSRPAACPTGVDPVDSAEFCLPEW